MDFEAIKNAEDLHRTSKEVIWQNFERLVAFIFEENGFQVKVNTVKTMNKKKRRQYDVIAKRNNKTLLIECKKWSGNRYRLSQLKKAIDQHKERTQFYRDITQEDAAPIIVTLIEEEIRFYEEVPIVPISRLNSFVNEVLVLGLDIPSAEEICESYLEDKIS